MKTATAFLSFMALLDSLQPSIHSGAARYSDQGARSGRLGKIRRRPVRRFGDLPLEARTVGGAGGRPRFLSALYRRHVIKSQTWREKNPRRGPWSGGLGVGGGYCRR